MAEDRIKADGPDPLAGFHLGDMPQRGIPPDLTEEEQASLAAEQATLKVPPSWPPEPPEAAPAEAEEAPRAGTHHAPSPSAPLGTSSARHDPRSGASGSGRG